MAMQPMAMYGLEVPAGDVAIPAQTGIVSAFRLTMAAIDPSAEPEGEEGAIPRATLKVIRQALVADSDDEDDDEFDDESFDEEEMERILAEEDSDESDEEANGGPSDPTKSKKAIRAALIKQALEQEMDVDGEDDDEDEDEMPNGVNGVAKSAKALGKMPASDEDDSDDLDDDDDDIEEFVICTLDPTKVSHAETVEITIR
jgi:FK506-binding nuclear protein